MRGHAGFTLMELMIVVLIMLLIATFAVPNYQHAMRKSRRTDAMTLLMDLHLRQAQWRTAHAGYADTLEALRAPSQHSALRHYQLTLSGASASAYRLQARARPGGGMTQDRISNTDCSTLEIDQAGTRTPTACWR